jgi:hypothetical protein
MEFMFTYHILYIYYWHGKHTTQISGLGWKAINFLCRNSKIISHWNHSNKIQSANFGFRNRILNCMDITSLSCVHFIYVVQKHIQTMLIHLTCAQNTITTLNHGGNMTATDRLTVLLAVESCTNHGRRNWVHVSRCSVQWHSNLPTSQC